MAHIRGDGLDGVSRKAFGFIFSSFSSLFSLPLPWKQMLMAQCGSRPDENEMAKRPSFSSFWWHSILVSRVSGGITRCQREPLNKSIEVNYTKDTPVYSASFSLLIFRE